MTTARAPQLERCNPRAYVVEVDLEAVFASRGWSALWVLEGEAEFRAWADADGLSCWRAAALLALMVPIHGLRHGAAELEQDQDHGDGCGLQVSIAFMAEVLMCSTATVKRAIRELKTRGYIKRFRRLKSHRWVEERPNGTHIERERADVHGVIYLTPKGADRIRGRGERAVFVPDLRGGRTLRLQLGAVGAALRRLRDRIRQCAARLGRRTQVAKRREPPSTTQPTDEETSDAGPPPPCGQGGIVREADHARAPAARAHNAAALCSCGHRRGEHVRESHCTATAPPPSELDLPPAAPSSCRCRTFAPAQHDERANGDPRSALPPAFGTGRRPERGGADSLEVPNDELRAEIERCWLHLEWVPDFDRTGRRTGKGQHLERVPILSPERWMPLDWERYPSGRHRVTAAFAPIRTALAQRIARGEQPPPAPPRPRARPGPFDYVLHARGHERAPCRRCNRVRWLGANGRCDECELRAQLGVGGRCPDVLKSKPADDIRKMFAAAGRESEDQVQVLMALGIVSSSL